MFSFEFGTDYEVFNNLGIPGTTFIGWPDNNYHTSADSPDKVDPTQLHRNVFAGLAAATMIAYADEGNASDLAQLALVYGKKRIHSSEERAANMVLCSTQQSFLQNKKWAKNCIRHAYGRETAAILSSLHFAREDQTKKTIRSTARLLEDDQVDSLRYVDELSGAKAKALKIADAKITLSPAEKKAARLVPLRIEGKELLGVSYVASVLIKEDPGDLMPLMTALNQGAVELRKQGVDDLRIFSLFEAPGYYADGQRSILDIRNAVAADLIPLPIDIVELYFRAFAKAGVMAIKEKP
jgi:hypothetical protein